VAAFVLIVVFVVLGDVLAVLTGALLGLVDLTTETESLGGELWLLFAGFGGGAALVLLWVRAYERRGLSAIGLGRRRALLRFGRGYLLGLACVLVTIGAIWAAGGYVVENGGALVRGAALAALGPIGLFLLAFIVQGSTEEIIARGWLMQVIASRYGVLLAILGNTALFTLAHAGNIAASPELALGLVNIALFAIAASLYAVKEGSIWGVCGWHASWNWLLGLGFGLEVSGQALPVSPLVIDLAARPDAAWWLTGRAFGPEGSVCETVLLALLALYFASRPMPTVPTETA
jgi:hypothetical protein